MADPPPGRLPSSAFIPFSVAERVHGPELNPEPVRSEERSLLAASEVAPSETMKDSACSLPEGASSDGEDGDVSCGDDDSINTEEEFRRDLEEQRIADEKNGHFSEAQPMTGERPMTSHLTPAFVSGVFLEVAAASCMNRARFEGENGGNGFVGNPPTPFTAKTDAYPSPTPINHHAASVIGMVSMGKEEKMGVGTKHGGSCIESTSKVVHAFQDGISAEYVTPLSMVRDNQFNALDDSPPLENAAFDSSHMEIENPHDLHEDLIGENHALLDLMESRSMVEQQIQSPSPGGPPILGSNSHSLGQVCPTLDSPSIIHTPSNFNSCDITNLAQTPCPTNFSHPAGPAQSLLSTKKSPLLPHPHQRNFTGSNAHLPKSPNTSIVKNQAHSKNNAQVHSKNNSQAHSKNKSQEIAASLFCGPSNGAQTGQILPVHKPGQPAFSDENLAGFPLLKDSVQVQNFQNVINNSGPPLPDYTHPQPPDLNPPHVTSQPVAAKSGRSWADMAENNPPHANGDGSKSHSSQNEQPEAASGGQPTAVFGRSMADVLRSGQPAEGPIFLDRDKAERRGEVRIVEGKPCLFFSANETSTLAGRLGPAIVGKFSHSIPPARQIQKALGNLKLFGAMSWNFLNAKHIFIELSDMRDYVKILNGPNNSPIWYIDHHPMRVFKWTPDFDPFFESPIITAWCNILALPVHLFEESSLIAIGEMLGKPVQVDRATINRTRVSFARICVEVDLSRPIVEEVDINIAGKHVTLKVKWEKIPLYCNECKHVGHSAMTCYASGKRPMPPKRDYSRRPPMQSRPDPSGYEAPSQPEQSLAEAFAAGRQPQDPRQQPRASQVSPRPSSKGGQQPRPEGRNQGIEVRQPPPSSVFYHGSSSTAAEGSHAANDDGFVAPKKNKKNKKKKAEAQRRRSRERRREEDLARYLGTRRMSDGERQSGADPDDSASQSERGSRSLSPSLRLGLGFGPLAMIPHASNMFGALNSPSSDEDAPDPDDGRFDELDDGMMVDDSVRRIHFTEPAVQYIGYTSPPPEGTPKRAKFSASPPY